MQSLLPNMRLVRRISFLSRPVSGTLLSRPIQLGLLSRCHLSSSVILQKEPPKGFSNFGNKTPDKKGGRKRRESRKQTQKETENEDSVEDEAEKSKGVKKEVKFEFKFGGNSPKKDPKKNDDKKKKDSDDEGFEGFHGEPKYQYGFFGLLTAIIGSYLYENMGFDMGEQSTMNAFLNDVSRGGVTSLRVVNREKAYYKAGGGPEKHFDIGSIDHLEDAIRRIQDKNDINLENRLMIRYESALRPWSAITNNIFPIGLLLFFLYRQARGGAGAFIQSSQRQVTSKSGKAGAKGKKGGGGGGNNPFNPMGQLEQTKKSTAVIIEPEDIHVRFKDVAGCEEAKVEIMEFVSFLKSPEAYEELGAKIPKGAILNGPPGTGKTLLGKATAGEAGVTFMSVNGSEFQEMFVGVGAARVRDMFETARENAPAILFIDEIDAVGRKRGGRMGSGEADVTLNQILTEMDGFNSIGDRVVVMAATNRLDTLDDALLRPGRFDRQVYVGAPDIKGRAEILKIHLKDKKLHSDLSLEDCAKKLAARTPGMSGADLANVCNEGALMAARQGQKSITFDNFNKAIDRVIAGIEKKSNVIKPHEKSKIAHHEAGHAVAGWFLEHADPLVKVTIVPRGRALGFAMYQPSDLNLMPEEQILDRICVSLGGRVAEQLFFNSVTTGASDDLDKVTKMAYAMVNTYGFSEKIGQVNFSNMGDGMNKPYSDATGKEIDEEVKRIVDEQWDRTVNLLTEKKDILEKLAHLLLEQETIERQDLVETLGPRPFKEMTTYEEYVAETSQKDNESTPAGLEDVLPNKPSDTGSSSDK